MAPTGKELLDRLGRFAGVALGVHALRRVESLTQTRTAQPLAPTASQMVGQAINLGTRAAKGSLERPGDLTVCAKSIHDLLESIPEEGRRLSPVWEVLRCAKHLCLGAQAALEYGKHQQSRNELLIVLQASSQAIQILYELGGEDPAGVEPATYESAGKDVNELRRAGDEPVDKAFFDRTLWPGGHLSALESLLDRYAKGELRPSAAEGSQGRRVSLQGNAVGQAHVSARATVKTPVGSDLFLAAAESDTLLGAELQANALIEVITSSDREAEVCLGVLGHWGRGKTHLADLVTRRLPEGWKAINFSAWKYRRRQETWAFLYETFRLEMQGTGWLSSIVRGVRGALHKNGIGPVNWALLSIAVAFLPLGSILYTHSAWVLSLFGVFGVYRLFAVFRKGQKQSKVFKNYLSLTDHSSELGLQATLGRDLESLLVGWTGRDSDSIATWGGLGYALCAILLLCCLWFGLGGWRSDIVGPTAPVAVGSSNSQERGWIDAKFTQGVAWIERRVDFTPWSAADEYPTLEMRLFLVVLVALPLVFAPLVLLWRDRDTQRFLLVVDDLDRVPRNDLLEIIESIKLLLEDKLMRHRVVIMMLVEEHSLRAALREKYGRDDGGLYSREVEENLQKLLVAHLRLSPLTEAEQLEYLASLTGHGGESKSPRPARSEPQGREGDTESPKSAEGKGLWRRTKAMFARPQAPRESEREDKIKTALDEVATRNLVERLEVEREQARLTATRAALQVQLENETDQDAKHRLERDLASTQQRLDSLRRRWNTHQQNIDDHMRAFDIVQERQAEVARLEGLASLILSSETGSEARLTSQEHLALERALGILAKKEASWAHPGPRAIQTLVFRYKLARALAQRMQGEGVNELSVDRLAELLAAELGGIAKSPGSGILPPMGSREDQVLIAAVEQVA